MPDEKVSVDLGRLEPGDCFIWRDHEFKIVRECVSCEVRCYYVVNINDEAMGITLPFDTWVVPTHKLMEVEPVPDANLTRLLEEWEEQGEHT